MNSERYYAARYDGEPEIEGDYTDEFAVIAYDTIVRCAADHAEAEYADNGIVFEKLGLTLSCSIQRIGEANDNYSAEMLFILSHSIFDEPLCEYTAGIGNSAEEAIVNGANQFCLTVLYSVISVLDSRDEQRVIVSEFAGLTRRFRCPNENRVYCIGAPQGKPVPLFDIVSKLIPDYLGSKNAYWVKLYAVCYDDTTDCEVRINGAVMNGLSELMYKYADTWPDKKTFHSEKQFVLLVSGDERSGREYTSPETVIALTKSAAKMLSSVDSEESDIQATAAIESMCREHGDLGYELRALIPEIYTCTLFDLRQGDDVRLRMGDASVVLKRSQLRNLGYIEQGVSQYLSENAPSREESVNIMRLSSLFDAVSEAIEDGADIGSITVNDMTLKVPEDYELL